MNIMERNLAAYVIAVVSGSTGANIRRVCEIVAASKVRSTNPMLAEVSQIVYDNDPLAPNVQQEVKNVFFKHMKGWVNESPKPTNDPN